MSLHKNPVTIAAIVNIWISVLKGLFLRIIAALALLLWAIDMVFPWQQIARAGENPYATIRERGSLIVGTINNPIYYFIGNDGEAGLEYELAKNFADYLGVRLEIKTLENNDALFKALENHDIDIAAANLLFHGKRAEQFQVAPPILLLLGNWFTAREIIVPTV